MTNLLLGLNTFQWATKDVTCQLCGSSKLTRFLDLGHHPPTLLLLTEEQMSSPETHYPLAVCRCQECGLVQVEHSVDPRILFSEYTYNSSATESFAKHLRNLSWEMTRRLRLGSNDLVIDVGSNDGTALEGYKSEGIRTLGIEPSVIAKLAMGKGIQTVNAFFDERVAKKTVRKEGKSRLVTAFNVLAHVKNFQSFLRGIRHLLADDGVFLSESHYLVDLLRKNEYDAIYHEHLRYYSLGSICEFLRRHRMEVFDALRVPTHGGSIRVFASHTGRFRVSRRVERLLSTERAEALNDQTTYNQFADRVAENRLSLKILLWSLKKRGMHIVGIGAPGRSTTLLNYCMIGPDLIDYVVETSPLKIGRYTPGTHVPILSETKLFEDEPEYALLLSWHLGDEITSKLQSKGFRGKFISPFPVPRVIDVKFRTDK